MKNKLLLIILFVTGNIFAQTNYLITQDSDGKKTYENVSDIGKLTFGTTFTCGDRLVYSNETYPTVLIGSQCWFAKNLNIGKRIDGATNQSSTDAQIEKYCYGDSDANCTTYGGLYQWAEVVAYTNGATNSTSPSPAFSGNIQGICPKGWHIPSFAEWQALGTAVSSDGNKLKAIGKDYLSEISTNTSGFSAVLAGGHVNTGNFVNLGFNTYFWSSTETSSTNVNLMLLGSINGDIVLSDAPKDSGFSIRCLKN